MWLSLIVIPYQAINDVVQTPTWDDMYAEHQCEDPVEDEGKDEEHGQSGVLNDLS